MVNSPMNVSTQYVSAIKNVNRMLWIIGNIIEGRDVNIIMTLSTLMVWLHLDYRVQFWLSHMKKDVIKPEKVQRRSTKTKNFLLTFLLRRDCSIGRFLVYKLDNRDKRWFEVYKIMCERSGKDMLFYLS